jgi:signal transduction histidine kinase
MQKGQPDIYIAVILGMTGALLLAVSIVFFYIRYRWKFFKQNESIQFLEMSHQKALLAAAVHSQDEERKRIGRDLHDEIGSRLSGLRLQLQSAGPQQTTALKTNIDTIIARVRDISHELLPPGIELFGLADALEDLCATTGTASGIHISYSNNTGSDLGQLQADSALSLFRVLQELISNTLKHAAATAIELKLGIAAADLQIYYTDNGKGFDTAPAGKGMELYNIKSRLQVLGARWHMGSSPGNGFSIHIYYALK